MLTRTQLADVLWAISEAREYLDGSIDVVDGDYGEPRPNRAMTLCNQLDEAHTLIERELDARPIFGEPFPFSA